MLSEDRNNTLARYIADVTKIPLLTPKEELKLARQVQKGDAAAREKMIQANLRLVLKMAHEYGGFGLPLLDLVSEGNIGLMKAVERYDPSRGSKFSTYAAFWIKQSIKRALSNQAKTIRLPVHLIERLARMRKLSIELTEELGRQPTDAELAEALGIPVYKVTLLKQVSTKPASLQALAADDELAELVHTIPDPNMASPFENLEERDFHNRVHNVIAQLDERERAVLSLRFPLEDQVQMTLEDVGAKFNLTRERIRQIQNQALKKIKKALAQRDKIRSLKH